jgi:hypothetical protein
MALLDKQRAGTETEDLAVRVEMLERDLKAGAKETAD